MPTPSGENTNGSSGVCMGCCLGEDANLAAAPLAQSLFFRPRVFRPRERRPPRGRRRHAMAVEALVPPDATRIATRGTAHSATVYTNGKKRCREAILADLCTLLRPHVCPQRCNSVHKWSETAPRGYFSQSVYTPLPPGTGRPCGIHVDAHPHDRLVRPRPNRPRMGEVTRLTQRTDYLCAKTHTPAQARPERHEQRGDGGNPRPQGHLKEVRQSNRRKVVR